MLAKHPLPLTHFNKRPSDISIDTLVIHSMYCPSAPMGQEFDVDRCVQTLEQAQVSAHYTIDRSGQVYAHVEEQQRAWHAGVSRMPGSDGRENVNDFSIGIELIGSPESGFTDAQYSSLVDLSLEISSRHNIKNFVGHDQISPGRKSDPGPAFDWTRYMDAMRNG